VHMQSGESRSSRVPDTVEGSLARLPEPHAVASPSKALERAPLAVARMLALLASVRLGAADVAPGQIDEDGLAEVGRLCAELLRGRAGAQTPSSDGQQVVVAQHNQRNTQMVSVAVRRATVYLRANHANPDLTLDVAAKVACLSRWHFSRTFRAQTGLRFVEYLNGIRLRQAATLLAETDLPVAEIARRVGYRQSGHFQRTFKRWAGLSPSGYRQLPTQGPRLDVAPA
jgi:AraC-like DNA-binding protein